MEVPASASIDFSNRANGNRVETTHEMGGSAPLRFGMKERTRVARPPAGISGKRAVSAVSPNARATVRDIAGKRFPSAEHMTASRLSREANASEAGRTCTETPRMHHSERIPERMIRLKFMLSAM
jgi:hypothetical protein